jgi:hypothetical protein
MNEAENAYTEPLQVDFQQDISTRSAQKKDGLPRHLLRLAPTELRDLR